MASLSNLEAQIWKRHCFCAMMDYALWPKCTAAGFMCFTFGNNMLIILPRAFNAAMMATMKIRPIKQGA
ncbi:MAG: hypothetical protein WAW41_12180 [Methylobacter sp.]